MQRSAMRCATVFLGVAFLLVLSGAGATVLASAPRYTLQQPPAARPQGGAGTQVVPDCNPARVTCNIYAYGGEWVADPNAMMTGTGGFFAVKHQSLSNTTFQYFETPWVRNHVPDNEALVQSFAAAVLAQMGQSSPSPVATGVLADGTLWHLYAVPFGPDVFGMLLTADTGDPSRNDVTTMLISPADTFDQALAAVQADILVNDASPLAGIDPAQAVTALRGGAVTPVIGKTPSSGTTPAARPTPRNPIGRTPAVTPTPTTGPSVSLDRSATAGSDNIAYGGDWTYDTANSAAPFASFRTTLDPRVIFGYGQGADRMSGGDAQLAMQILDPPSAFAAANARQVAGETLPSGRSYALYTWERDGAAEVALIVVDVTTTPGIVRMQVLFAPPELFVSTLSSIQKSFQINGEAPFRELDTSTLARLIGSGTDVTPATNTTSLTSASIADYRTLDASVACDALG